MPSHCPCHNLSPLHPSPNQALCVTAVIALLLFVPFASGAVVRPSMGFLCICLQIGMTVSSPTYGPYGGDKLNNLFRFHQPNAGSYRHRQRTARPQFGLTDEHYWRVR